MFQIWSEPYTYTLSRCKREDDLHIKLTSWSHRGTEKLQEATGENEDTTQANKYLTSLSSTKIVSPVPLMNQHTLQILFASLQSSYYAVVVMRNTGVSLNFKCNFSLHLGKKKVVIYKLVFFGARAGAQHVPVIRWWHCSLKQTVAPHRMYGICMGGSDLQLSTSITSLLYTDLCFAVLCILTHVGRPDPFSV